MGGIGGAKGTTRTRNKPWMPFPGPATVKSPSKPCGKNRSHGNEEVPIKAFSTLPPWDTEPALSTAKSTVSPGKYSGISCSKFQVGLRVF